MLCMVIYIINNESEVTGLLSDCACGGLLCWNWWNVPPALAPALVYDTGANVATPL